MLLQAPQYNGALLAAFRTGWRPCVAAYSAGDLTADEVEGLKGVMGLFLREAVPMVRAGGETEGRRDRGGGPKAVSHSPPPCVFRLPFGRCPV